MNGDPADLLRSLRRYVALTLGTPPWTVRVGRVRVADDARPTAVVEPSSPTTTRFARAGGLSQGDVQQARTFTVVAYPALSDTAGGSLLEAERVAELLAAGVGRGLVDDSTPPVNIGAPWRLPVWDYAGVPITGAGRAGPADPYTYATIEDRGFSTRPIQDPMDELRYTVIATIPVTWWRGGRAGPGGPTVTGMPGTGTVSP